MYYDKKHIQINQNGFDFKYEIRSVEQYKDAFIVLLEIPYDETVINNIYCLDNHANLVWQVEDLSTIYPKLKNLPFEQMGIKDNALYASDFYGRNYKINIETGKIESCRIVK